MRSKASDPSALHVVLLQEVERYNSLLVCLRSSCSQVQAGLKGLTVMSADLDEIADALFNAKVHPSLNYQAHTADRFSVGHQTFQSGVPLVCNFLGN